MFRPCLDRLARKFTGLLKTFYNWIKGRSGNRQQKNYGDVEQSNSRRSVDLNNESERVSDDGQFDKETDTSQGKVQRNQEYEINEIEGSVKTVSPVLHHENKTTDGDITGSDFNESGVTGNDPGKIGVAGSNDTNYYRVERDDAGYNCTERDGSVHDDGGYDSVHDDNEYDNHGNDDIARYDHVHDDREHEDRGNYDIGRYDPVHDDGERKDHENDDIGRYDN